MAGGGRTGPELLLCFAPGLRLFLGVRHRAGRARAPADGTSSLGHVVQSLGVPLPEVGELLVDDRPARADYRPRGGERVLVRPVRRPQRLPEGAEPRFVGDVHLGALARRLRLVGADTAYRNDLGDDALLAQANAERRVLLTRDRGLLGRRLLWRGAYVRGERPDDQLADVLDRFAPPLAPWTRCMACNGLPVPVAKAQVAPLLLPGTLRTYDSFTRCPDCGRVYWRGAHGGRLDALVARAVQVVAAAGGGACRELP